MDERATVWHDVSVNVGWGFLRGKTCIVGGNPLDVRNGLRVVCIHGWLDNCNSFDTLVPLLPSNTIVLVLDLPGHGLSDHLPLGAHYNPFVYAMNVRTAIIKLKWKKFVIMGHSMGSAVSSVFSALFPEHVKAFISLDYVAPFRSLSFVEQCRMYTYDLLKAEQRAQQHPLVFSEKEAIDRLVSARVFGYSDEATVDREAAQTLLPRSARQVTDGYVWTHDRKARATFQAFVSGTNWTEIISSIECPVLIIQASRGTGIISKELTEGIFSTYRKHSSSFHVHMVEGSHHVHLTEAERVAPIVTEFLTNVVKNNALHAKL